MQLLITDQQKQLMANAGTHPIIRRSGRRLFRGVRLTNNCSRRGILIRTLKKQNEKSITTRYYHSPIMINNNLTYTLAFFIVILNGGNIGRFQLHHDITIIDSEWAFPLSLTSNGMIIIYLQCNNNNERH